MLKQLVHTVTTRLEGDDRRREQKQRGNKHTNARTIVVKKII